MMGIDGSNVVALLVKVKSNVFQTGCKVKTYQRDKVPYPDIYQCTF